MLVTVAQGCLCLMTIMLIGQILSTRRYLHWFNSYRDANVADSDLLTAAIVLSLRGADPSLNECLDRLIRLDYPRYEVHVVVDNSSDPAYEVATNWVSMNSGKSLRVHVLREVSSHAYLKPSAIRQCLRQLPDYIQTAVMVDADTLVYPAWLREMMSPFVSDRTIGLVTGNRWYDPTQMSWGARVRFSYNANAVVPMYFMKATWGGSLAIRRQVFSTDYFLERLWNTSSEESAMQDATRQAGLQLAVTPMVMMYNRKTISLRNCFRFMRRQLVWTRLYHANWNQVVAGSLGVYAILAAAVVLARILTIQNYYFWGLALIGGLFVMTGVNLVTIQWLHQAIAKRA